MAYHASSFTLFYQASLLVLFSATALSILAKPVSSFDEYILEQERENLLREQPERIPSVLLLTPARPQGLERLPADEASCTTIKTIRLSGDSANQFQWAIAAANQTADGAEDRAIGRCLGLRGVNLVTRRIQNAIIARGFVTTRVLVWSQENLAEEILALTLFPGRIRHIKFAQGTDMRATKWNAISANPGDLLNLHDIEQALENFKRIPNTEVDIQITPTQESDAKFNQSDLIIIWKQSFPFRINFSADNSGDIATGKYHGNITFSYDNPFTLNDLFYINFNNDLGKSGAGAGPYGTGSYLVYYSVPWDYWLLTFTANQSRYRQSVPGASQIYLYSGKSKNSEIKLSRLIYRNAVRKITFFAKSWIRTSNSFIDDTEIEVQRRRMAGFDFGISYSEFIKNAILDINLNYRSGTGAFNALKAPEETFNEGTSRPKIIMLDLKLNLPFKVAQHSLRYISSLRAQWNKTSLITQDYFAIGNRYTVRGFDGENQLLAERGWLIRNDLGVMLGGQEFYLGVDYGQVSGPTSNILIGKHLSGAVLGLRGAFKNISYDVFIGKPLDKPSRFPASRMVTGFNVNWSF